jgi:nitrate/nitrite-specific signal transduction histidine kinase
MLQLNKKVVLKNRKMKKENKSLNMLFEMKDNINELYFLFKILQQLSGTGRYVSNDFLTIFTRKFNDYLSDLFFIYDKLEKELQKGAFKKIK